VNRRAQDDDSSFELHGTERPETWTQDTHAKVIILLGRSDFFLICIFSCCCSDFSLQELDALAAAGFVDRNTRSLLISAAITPYLFPILPLFVRFRLLHIVRDLIMFSSLPMLSPRIIFHELGSTLSLSLLIALFVFWRNV
jgi:hypothetical protein